MINRDIPKLGRKAEYEEAKDCGNNPFRYCAYHMIIPTAIRGIPKRNIAQYYTSVNDSNSQAILTIFVDFDH